MTEDFDKFNKLNQYLKGLSEGTEGNHPPIKKFSLEEELAKSSSRHHYIPKYFIDGFLNQKQELWVYDKKQGKIQNKTRPSKSIFFEEHRNSVDLGFKKPLSIFEDAYSVMDNILPPAIRILRGDAAFSPEMFTELTAHLNVFITDLFWRNINTDELFNRLYQNGPITIKDDTGNVYTQTAVENLKKVPGFQQLVRLSMREIALRDFTRKPAEGFYTSDLFVFPNAPVCVGDMPFLFKQKPKQHIDLINLPAFIPISKSKIFMRSIKNEELFRVNDLHILNALIIEQSTKYICAADRETLSIAIEYYNKAREKKLFADYLTELFGNS